MKRVPLEIVLISGLSGSGKSTALNVLEDAGYFAIDNLPGVLFPALLANLEDRVRLGHIRKIALAMDAREKGFLNHFDHYFRILKRRGLHSRVFFFDARDDVLIRRFSETRRRHPLAPTGRVARGIRKEREMLHPIRAAADDVIDTSTMNAHQLRDTLLDRLRGNRPKKELSVMVISFGYRYGLPLEADLVLDVRFLPNPHFIPRLKPLSGKEAPVASFVFRRKETKRFLKTLNPLFQLLLREYLREGKAYLNISFGCTGGRHRSVAIAERVASDLKKQGYAVKLLHRDLNRED